MSFLCSGICRFDPASIHHILCPLLQVIIIACKSGWLKFCKWQGRHGGMLRHSARNSNALELEYRRFEISIGCPDSEAQWHVRTPHDLIASNIPLWGHLSSHIVVANNTLYTVSRSRSSRGQLPARVSLPAERVLASVFPSREYEDYSNSYPT